MRRRHLQTVAALCLLADHVEHVVHELGALGVMALGPVVASATLSEDEVVRAEELSVRSAADRVHGPGLEVHQHRTRNVLAS